MTPSHTHPPDTAHGDTAQLNAALAAAPLAARPLLRLLRDLPEGRLELTTPEGHLVRLGRGTSPIAALSLSDWRVMLRVLKSGDIGFAEAYRDGLWRSPDSVALLRVFIRNRAHLEQAIYGRWWGQLLYRLRHLANRNSRSGSSKNIHAHYDIGNAFYRLWLDEGMNYSSAWFERPDLSLAEAQRAKTRRALEELAIAPGQRVLEIGCGWGALAEMARRDFKADIEGITLSTEQLVFAKQRLAKDGLNERASLHLRDYRDYLSPAHRATFDAVVSIEMFEAVGQSYWPSYFKTIQNVLKPGGKACVQSIVIRDDLFARYQVGTDFIQQYIFPGGMLPSDSEFKRQAADAGLRVVAQHAFGLDYARTLALWREAFLARRGDVMAQGFDAAFMKVWEFYLVYCEAAFAEGNTDVIQYTLEHDRASR